MDETKDQEQPTGASGASVSSPRRGGKPGDAPAADPPAVTPTADPPTNLPAVDGGDDDGAPKQAAEDAGFSRERLLGPEGGDISGHPAHVIAGALHGDDQDSYTRDEVEAKVAAFLKREIPTED